MSESGFGDSTGADGADLASGEANTEFCGGGRVEEPGEGGRDVVLAGAGHAREPRNDW